MYFRSLDKIPCLNIAWLYSMTEFILGEKLTQNRQDHEGKTIFN